MRYHSLGGLCYLGGVWEVFGRCPEVLVQGLEYLTVHDPPGLRWSCTVRCSGMGGGGLLFGRCSGADQESAMKEND